MSENNRPFKEESTTRPPVEVDADRYDELLAAEALLNELNPEGSEEDTE